MPVNNQNFSKAFAQTLIWHRKKSRMSQNELALMASVSRTAVQRLEKGLTTVQLDTLLKVLEALNINLNWDSPLKEVFEKAQNYEKS